MSVDRIECVTKTRLREIADAQTGRTKWLLENIINECVAVPILTAVDQDLIIAAERYAKVYDGDPRQDIKVDVLNAFYHGAYFKELLKNEKL
jgi:hypothetical protein